MFSEVDKIFKEMDAQESIIMKGIQIDGNLFDNDNFPSYFLCLFLIAHI